MPVTSLADFARSFDRASLQPRCEEAERGRQRLRGLFPREVLATLPLERYAIGLGEGTLCYEYEFGSRAIGSIQGGSAFKFLIFFNKAKGVWKSTVQGEPDPQKAWELLRADLVRALDLAEQGRWDELDALPVAGYTPALRGKLAHVFFPDEVLPIFAFGQLQHFLGQVGVDFKRTSGVSASAANRRLLEKLWEVPELANWSTSELAYLLYEWSPPPPSKKSESFEDFLEDFDRSSLEPQLNEAEAQRQRILTLHPQERLAELTMEGYVGGNEVSEENLAPLLARGSSALGGDIRGVGGNAVGIVQLKGTGLYRSTLRETGDALADWPKLRGALVKCCELANQGQWAAIDSVSPANWIPALRTKLLHVYFPDEVLPIFLGPELGYYLEKFGIKERSGPGKYAATPNRRLLEHLRSLPALEGWSTLEMAIALRAWSPMKGAKEMVDQPDVSGDNEAIFTPTPMPPPALNRILYGPPGTGKTYNVIREAARIVTGHTTLDDKAAKHEFDEVLKTGRIRLATFHQSFSYEDFIEGIRPTMDDDSGTARFEVRDGVFKTMALEALGASLERTQVDDFEGRWLILLEKLAAEGTLDIPGLKEVTWTVSETRAGNLDAINKVSGSKLTCGRVALAQVWRALSPRPRVSSMEVSQALGKGAHFGVVAAVYNYLQGLGESTHRPTQTVADPVTAAKDYLSLGESSGWRVGPSRPPFVLIIDEINRGNIQPHLW